MSRFGDTAPPFHYIAYIDEAGDPGIDSVQRAGRQRRYRMTDAMAKVPRGFHAATKDAL
jgi:hypothetical protein